LDIKDKVDMRDKVDMVDMVDIVYIVYIVDIVDIVYKLGIGNMVDRMFVSNSYFLIPAR
jgi:hypothetical protein